MSPPSHLGPYWQVSGLRLEQRKRDLIFYRHECYIRKYSGVFRHYRFSKLPKVYWTLSWFAKKLSQNFSTASDFQFPKNFQEISMLSELPKEFHTEAWWYQYYFLLLINIVHDDWHVRISNPTIPYFLGNISFSFMQVNTRSRDIGNVKVLF